MRYSIWEEELKEMHYEMGSLYHMKMHKLLMRGLMNMVFHKVTMRILLTVVHIGRQVGNTHIFGVCIFLL